MAQSVIEAEVADKIFELSEQFNQYVFAHPEILDEIPDRAVLVFVDAADPEFTQASIALAEATPAPAGSQRVYVKMSRHVRLVEQVDWTAEIVSGEGAELDKASHKDM